MLRLGVKGLTNKVIGTSKLLKILSGGELSNTHSNIAT